MKLIRLEIGMDSLDIGSGADGLVYGDTYTVAAWYDSATLQMGLWMRSLTTGTVCENIQTASRNGITNAVTGGSLNVGGAYVYDSYYDYYYLDVIPSGGWLDGLWIWSRSLTSGDRNQLYNDGIGKEYSS
jgi:hypothetical protein